MSEAANAGPGDRREVARADGERGLKEEDAHRKATGMIYFMDPLTHGTADTTEKNALGPNTVVNSNFQIKTRHRTIGQAREPTRAGPLNKTPPEVGLRRR